MNIDGCLACFCPSRHLNRSSVARDRKLVMKLGIGQKTSESSNGAFAFAKS